MSKKTYILEETGHYQWEMIVTIDHSDAVDELLKQMTSFHVWDKVHVNEYDRVLVFLEKLGEFVLPLSLKGLNFHEVLERIYAAEEFSAMGGTEGIEITSIDGIDFDFEWNLRIETENPMRYKMKETELSLVTTAVGDLLPELKAHPELKQVRQLAFQHWDEKLKNEVQVHVIVIRDPEEFLEPFDVEHIA